MSAKSSARTGPAATGRAAIGWVPAGVIPGAGGGNVMAPWPAPETMVPPGPPNPSSAVGRSAGRSARVPGPPSPTPCRPAGTARGCRTAGSSAAARLRSWMAAGRWAGSRRSAAASSSAIGAGTPDRSGLPFTIR